MAATPEAVAPKTERIKKAPAYSWAVNPHKLRLATQYVRDNQPALKEASDDFETAVKERYVVLKGRVVGDVAAGAAPRGRGRVVNVAADDGSEDIENDEA